MICPLPGSICLDGEGEGEPLLISLSTHILPSIISTNLLLMARPRPVPPPPASMHPPERRLKSRLIGSWECLFLYPELRNDLI